MKKLVMGEVPEYPIDNIEGEAKRVADYLEGKGRYGWALPANWAKMFLELTKGNPRVVAALKQQQDLYEQKDGKRNGKLDRILNEYRD